MMKKYGQLYIVKGLDVHRGEIGVLTGRQRFLGLPVGDWEITLPDGTRHYTTRIMKYRKRVKT